MLPQLQPYYNFPSNLLMMLPVTRFKGKQYPIVVALDFNSIFDDTQTHFMLSRVQLLNQVYILKNLYESKLRTNNNALQELHRMNKISINENRANGNIKKKTGTIKIISLVPDYMHTLVTSVHTTPCYNSPN